MTEIQPFEPDQIQNLIYTVRGKQIMLDRDLAILYGVQTGRLNEAVKRNSDRFPAKFMFRLTKNELDNWMSQIAISNKEKMGIRKMPYAFTEQGIAMLSTVLRSKRAVKISIQIMDAFIAMRKLIGSNARLFQRVDRLELRQVEYDQKFDRIFEAIERREISPKQGIIYDGQIFDAHVFVSKIIRSAKKSIILIDNYINDGVLTLLTDRKKGVRIKIYTKSVSKRLALDIKKYNEQYGQLVCEEQKKIHDRFIIIDEKEIYHYGASLKDLGKKISAFSRFEKDSLKLIGRLE